ncbi:hypothetical protein GCM10027290_49630 [Micromonospora sonneratiae]|uniref:Uncharacterized protein n=1 Tax=Micromonospora sonneratiae TaxID=1184706 RepID=A0ABW3YMW4_9ACTN
MDLLDRLSEPATDLLARVDDTLTDLGAPDGHPIWPLLRRLRTLPGAAAKAITALQPAALAGAGAQVRGLTSGYDHTRATLTGSSSWQGAGADAYDVQRAALAAHLADGPDGITGRLTDTADFADALVDWAAGARAALAGTLAEVLASAEAVALVTGLSRHSDLDPDGSADRGGTAAAQAAAEIGVRVLSTVAEAYDHAAELLRRWEPRLARVPYHPGPDGVVRLDSTIRVAD